MNEYAVRSLSWRLGASPQTPPSPVNRLDNAVSDPRLYGCLVASHHLFQVWKRCRGKRCSALMVVVMHVTPLLPVHHSAADVEPFLPKTLF